MQLRAVNQTTYPRRGPKRAYTIIEVLVAVAVVGVGIITLYLGISFGFATIKTTREDLRATQILLERMEGIRLFNWNQLMDAQLNPGSFTNYYYPLAISGQSKGMVYSGTMAVSDVTLEPAATYTNLMKKVTVTVGWKSGNVRLTRTMSTHVCKYGMQNYIYAN